MTGRKTPQNSLFRGDSRLEADRAKARIRAGQPSRNPHLGVAKVINVNYEEFFVTLKIVIGDDQENIRIPVPLTSPGGGARHFFGSMPMVGDTCVVGWMPQETLGAGQRDTEGTKIPVILSWVLPGAWLGHDWVVTSPFEDGEMPMSPTRQSMLEGTFHRIRHKRMHLRPGDIAASSEKGSDILLNEGVYITNRRANEIRLRDQDQAFVVRSQQQFHVASGVRTYAGMVQRDAQLVQFSLIGEDPLNRNLGFSPTNTVTDLSDSGEPVSMRAWPKDSYTNQFGGMAGSTPLLSSGFQGGTSAGVVYGGKRFLRLGPDGRNISGTLNRAAAEYRVEVAYSCRQTLPISEQTEPLDSVALNTGVQFVLGNVFGNDPTTPGYGVPCRPVVFQDRVAKSELQYTLEAPQWERSASLFHVATVGTTPDEYSGDTWWSVTKGGAFKARIGGKRGDDTIQVSTDGGVHVAGSHMLFGSRGPISFINESNTDAENVGIGWKSSGAIVIEASGQLEGTEKDFNLSQPQGQDGETNLTPSILLKGAHVKTEGSNATFAASDKVDITSENTHISGQSQLALKADSGTITLSASEYQEAVMGRKVRKYTGARDDFPTKFPIRETTFAPGGPISVAVCLMQDVDVIEYAAGSRHEKFQTGGHAGHYYLGSTVYKHNVGGFEAHAGGVFENSPFANSLKLTTKGGFEAKVTVGNATMKTTVGTATVSSKVNTNISALVGGVKISSATVITLSSPGSTKYGGIVCGSDLHPIIGQPLAAPTCGLMGSKTVTITP